MFKMKESLVDLDSENQSPEKTSLGGAIKPKFSQKFNSPTLEQKKHNKRNTKPQLNHHNPHQYASFDMDEYDDNFKNDQCSPLKYIGGMGGGSSTQRAATIQNLKYYKSSHSQDNLQGSFGPQSDMGAIIFGFKQNLDYPANGDRTHLNKSEDYVLQNFLKQEDKGFVGSGEGNNYSFTLSSNSVKMGNPASYENQQHHISDDSSNLARYTFKAEKDQDLSFNAGEEIKNEKKRDNGWWLGSCNGVGGGKKDDFP